MSVGPVVLLAGSLRAGAHTSVLLRQAGTLLPRRFELVVADDIRPLPHYDADLDGEASPLAVRRARRTVASASALIISTPEYNGAIPGGLKNWIDWVTRPPVPHPLIGKPVAVIGASPGSKGAITAVTWLRDTLGYLGAAVVGDAVAIPDVVGSIGDDGVVSDELVERLGKLIDALVVAIDS